MIRRESKQTGSYRGPEPERSGHRPRPWAWARLCMAGLAVLAGLTLPAVTASPAWAAGPPNAYVPNADADNVSVIDTTTNQVVGSPIPVGDNPRAVAVTPDSTRVYVTNAGNQAGLDTVSVIDTNTNTVVGSPITVGDNPRGIAITPNGQRAYVTNSGTADSVSVIDTTNNTVVGTPITVGQDPQGVAITPNGQRAYVTNTGTDNVSVIDTNTNTVVASPTVGEAPIGVAITPDGTRAYVTNYGGQLGQNDTVSVINTSTNQVVGSPITVGDGPASIAISPIIPPPQAPSLTIDKSHTGNFIQGRQGTYTITVGNNGTAPTNGTTVTVHDTLPAGLTAARIRGSGWSCSRDTVTCTRSSVLAAGSSYPPITLTVRVARNAPAQVTNTATVTGGGDTVTHSDSDPTTISPRGWQNWSWNRP